MSKKQKNQTDKTGEQLDLIDVHPKDARPIIAAAKILKKFQVTRSSAQDKENNQKALLLHLVEKANIPRLPDGRIKFHYDGILLTITPKQESISIKEED